MTAKRVLYALLSAWTGGIAVGAYAFYEVGEYEMAYWLLGLPFSGMLLIGFFVFVIYVIEEGG